MFHQLKTYVQWYPKTFHLHGIHSPFVFKFQKECLQDRTPLEGYKKLETYRNTLLSNPQEIEVTDFGAGSRIFKSNTRKISAVARHAGATTKRMQLLHRLVKYLQPAYILELGTSLGMATYAMASASPTTKIASLEGCPATAGVARKTLHTCNSKQVEIVEGRFRESIQTINKQPIDFIYFDGNHAKEATLNYVKELLPTANNGTVWVFDDIHWSPAMTEAWEHIKALPEVSVTIDCYWIGFAFFRNEQVKEDFYVRL